MGKEKRDAGDRTVTWYRGNIRARYGKAVEGKAIYIKDGVGKAMIDGGKRRGLEIYTRSKPVQLKVSGEEP
jgi:hypothetical protein